MKKPLTRRYLDKAIEDVFGRGASALKARAIIANVIVGQMIPDGAVKGGSSIKLRLGHESTRATTDLDVARASDLDSWILSLSDSLENGWEGFTGHIVEREPASPEGVPSVYVMLPFDVKLNYNGKPWLTVELEVGHDEIGDADEPEFFLPEYIKDMFGQIGLPEPEPVPLMTIPYQIAQKLHGLSEQNSNRAHDLIDLQIIVSGCEVDYRETRTTCERLFAYRKAQTWPPEIKCGEGWQSLYQEQIGSLKVLDDLSDAIDWVNELIVKISKS